MIVDQILVQGATDAVAQLTAVVSGVLPIALGLLGTVVAAVAGFHLLKRLIYSAT